MHVVGSVYAEKVEVRPSGVNSGDTPLVPLLTVRGVSAPEGVAYGFTTRAGGVSPGAQASLNLAVRAGASPIDVSTNWERAVGALHGALGPASVALMDQVHGARVLRVDAGAGPLSTLGEADGAWTVRRGVVLAVRTADCVPIVFMGGSGVAVAHAGWRGAAAGVVSATVLALCEGTGMEPRDLVAVVGPHISGDAYEVGVEVVDGLVSSGLDPADFVVSRSARGRPHVDLGRVVGAQLAALGVGVVAHVGGCTASDPELYSHRADGPDTGRQAGLVVRLP